MNRNLLMVAACISLFATFRSTLLLAAPQDEDSNTKAAAPAADTGHVEEEMMNSNEAEAISPELVPAEAPPVPVKPVKKSEKKRIERADAFVAGADWEFDGFVSGGQDQNIRTMFYQGDLVYLNIGGQHGITPGDRLVIYKRGERIRDPQTGKFIGYEVRRAAYARASDRVGDETCSVRISNTFEAVEIGDLVRRE